jgi:predicted NBD/HSP70 family sugar kinase
MALSDLLAHLRRFLDSTNAPVLGIGIGVPGSVESQSDGVVESTQLGWHQVALGEAVRTALAVPVMVENDVNALAMAERLFGRGHDHSDFLVVTIGTGIGAGIIAGGTLQRGRHGGSGDLGHVPMVENGPVCQCGNRGCLEALIGESALLDAACRRSVLAAHDGIDRLLNAADAGDVRAREIYADAGRQLGRALAGVVNVIDPSVVTLLGEGVAAWAHWQAGFEPAFRGGLVPRSRSISVIVESWKDDAWAQGAASLVLSTPFDSTGVAGDQGDLVRQRLLGSMTERVRA